jgi:hypothetical protein
LEYRGKEYSVVRDTRPATWKWSVQFDEATTQTGQIIGRRQQAEAAARRAIDQALAPASLKRVRSFAGLGHDDQI